MFRLPTKQSNLTYRWAFFGLAILSTAALIGSVWVLVDFFREQEIVADLIQQLPAESKESAKMLAGELRWQFRLSMIVLLNLIVTGIAIVLLWRAYQTSQESLRDIKVLSADILSCMEQAVITTDLLGVVTSINQRGLEVFECGLESIGKRLNEVATIVPLDEFRREWQRDSSPDRMVDYQIDKQGNSRTYRVFCQQLNDYEGHHNGFVLQLRDVTERVLIEERMLRMERYMALGSLAAGLHHEIRNPLAALSLHVQLIEEQLDENSAKPEVVEMFRIVKSEVARIGSVLESFRDFASIDNLSIGQVDLSTLCQNQLQLISPQCEQANIAINFQETGKPNGELAADSVRLEQVLLNLLINAMDAMPTGGDLSVNLNWLGSRVQLQIQDTGIGIPNDLHERIFHPYFTTKGEGTGLGLALCDKVVRQHQGTLTFDSQPGRTRFSITLPLQSSLNTEIGN